METRKLKTRMVNFSIFLGVIFFVGCNTQGEFYDKKFLEGLAEKNRLNWCSIDTTGVDDPVSVCESSVGCQAMLDINMNYLECIPVLSPLPKTDDGGSTDDTTSGGGDTGGDGSNSGSDDTTSGGDDSGDSAGDDEDERNIYEDAVNPGQEYQYLCQRICLENEDDEFDDEGNLVVEEKILVCHFPAGNVGKAHTICVGRPGWENGHSKHELDHEGACNDQDF